MKVVLTESQLDRLIQEEVNESNLLRSILGLNSPDKIVSKIVLALLLGTITFTALPVVLNKAMEKNPVMQNADPNALMNKIKTVFQRVKNNEAQVTDQMKTDAEQSVQQATDVSQDAISKICWWETRKEFGYKMQPKDLHGYYVKGENVKTYGYGLRTHPNGQLMQNIKSVWTQPELELLFKQKVEAEKNWVVNWASKNGVTLGQGQLDAMVSAVYNYGRNGFLKTGIPAMIAQNPNNPAIPQRWAHLADAKAKKYPGLVSRRTEEARWYNTDITPEA